MANSENYDLETAEFCECFDINVTVPGVPYCALHLGHPQMQAKVRLDGDDVGLKFILTDFLDFVGDAFPGMSERELAAVLARVVRAQYPLVSVEQSYSDDHRKNAKFILACEGQEGDLDTLGVVAGVEDESRIDTLVHQAAKYCEIGVQASIAELRRYDRALGAYVDALIDKRIVCYAWTETMAAAPLPVDAFAWDTPADIWWPRFVRGQFSPGAPNSAWPCGTHGLFVYRPASVIFDIHAYDPGLEADDEPEMAEVLQGWTREEIEEAREIFNDELRPQLVDLTPKNKMIREVMNAFVTFRKGLDAKATLAGPLGDIARKILFQFLDEGFAKKQRRDWLSGVLRAEGKQLADQGELPKRYTQMFSDLKRFLEQSDAVREHAVPTAIVSRGRPPQDKTL